MEKHRKIALGMAARIDELTTQNQELAARLGMSPRIRLKRFLWCVDLVDKSKFFPLYTSFTVGCYPDLTKKQATQIAKILYGDRPWKVVSIKNLHDT
jgi:hypothetical protein